MYDINDAAKLQPFVCPGHRMTDCSSTIYALSR